MQMHYGQDDGRVSTEVDDDDDHPDDGDMDMEDFNDPLDV
jgi:hypothetical protein